MVLAVPIRARPVQPHQASAKDDLVILVFTRQEIDELGRASFNCSTGIGVCGEDCLTERLQSFVIITRVSKYLGV